jgi:DNA-binding GntR family transcriptional regulator
MKMNQIRAKHTVNGIAGHLKNAGKRPALRAVCAGVDTQKMAEVQRHLALQDLRSHTQVVKTHIADAPAALQDLLAEDFEQGVIALRTRLESEYAEIKRDRDELANQNEQLFTLLESLTLTLDNAEIEATEFAMRIARLKNTISAERARAKAGQRMRTAAGVNES